MIHNKIDQDRCGWGRQPRNAAEAQRQWHAWCMGAKNQFKPWKGQAPRATIREAAICAAFTLAAFTGLLWIAQEVMR
jgi:hypothetical protein